MRFPRLSFESEPNAWAAAVARLRARERPLIDLTETDPRRFHASLPAQLRLGGTRLASPDPRGLLSAREAVAALYATKGVPVSADDVVLTASTSEAYAHLFRLLGAPGDTFVAQSPSYPLFEPIADSESVQIAPWRMHYDDGWFLFPKPEVSGRVGAVIVVQPNHPTGTWLADEDWTSVVDFAEAHGAPIVSDEVFGDYRWRDAARPPLLHRESAGPLCVVLGGLSKTCGLPHLKCSWVLASGPEEEKQRLLRGLEWLADLFLSVNAPVMEALPELLDGRHAFQDAVRATIRTNLARLGDATARQPDLSQLRAEGGWVAVLRVPAVRTGESWALELLERGVIVHPGYFYDLEGEAYLVVSLIVDPAIFDQGMTALEGLIGEG